MNKKLIFNLISLSVTTFLLVLVMFSWYVSNKEVKASGIIASTAGDPYTLHLERGTFSYVDDTDENNNFENNKGWIWQWKQTETMLFSDIQPGDTFFFRIVLDSSAESNMDFDISFSKIKSSLMSDIVKAYINKQLVKYTLTADATPQYLIDSTVVVGDVIPSKTYYEYDSTNSTYKYTTDYEFVSGKSYYKIKPYYIGVFTADNNVIVQDLVKPNTYYERKGAGTTESPYYYEMTTDAKYLEGKTYYKARFVLDTNPDFSTNKYYEKGELPTTKNAIGYNYDTDKYNYLYTLDAEDEVKIAQKVLYDYDRTKDIVELKDYLIEKAFKVYDIGTHKNQNTIYGKDDTTFTEDVYNYTYTPVPANATFNSKTTYYVYSNFYQNYVKSLDTKFENGTTYFTRGAKTTDVYASSKVKSLIGANFSFNATANDTTYYYFALEFNEAASLASIDGIQSSNCYLYQTLTIDQIEVNKQSED